MKPYDNETVWCPQTILPLQNPNPNPGTCFMTSPPHGPCELLVLLTWESFGEGVRGVVIGADVVVPDDRSCVKVAAVVIARIGVFRTSLGDLGGDVC